MQRRQITGILPALLSACLVSGNALAAFPYPEPTPTPEPEAATLTLSCAELDAAINRQQPYLYNYQPGFYEDHYKGAALWLGLGVTSLGLFYPPYAHYTYYMEEEQRRDARYQVDMLRQAKARQFCYSDHY